MSTNTTEAAVANPTASATAKYVRVSAQKVRRIIALIKGKPVTEALAILKYSPQSATDPLAKVLASAAANAENNLGLDPRTLFVSEAFANEGPTLKRFQPRAQGRAFRIRKRTSHITITVESRSADSTPRSKKGAK